MLDGRHACRYQKRASLWLSWPRRSASWTEKSKSSERRGAGDYATGGGASREVRTDSRGMLPWRGPPAGASNAPAPTDRPTVLATLHLTTCEGKRHPISNVLFASSRPDIFLSPGHKSSGQARRASAIDPPAPGGVPVPSLNHQHLQCRGKMRAQIESEAYELGIQGGGEEGGVFASIEETKCTLQNIG